MTEAYVLAGELDRADGDFARAFAAYERAAAHASWPPSRRPLSRFRGFFAPQTTLGLKVRNVAVSALSHRFLAKHLLARSLHDDLELPRYQAG